METASAPITVFYTPKMVADFRSISPSAAKPSKVVDSWRNSFKIDVIEPMPVTVDEISRAHDKAFVDDILACRIDNGFENRLPEVAVSLLYTSGAMLAAAKHALKHRVAVAPVSGFHHSSFSSAEGFCTFNGLMITALALKEEGLVKRVGILDLDMHYGNGTDDIITRLNARSWVVHYTGGAEFRHPYQAEHFFDKRLPFVLEMMKGCDVVLYQAGADPHINDPFGGWLSTEQLRRRDAMVFDALSTSNVPVAWNLAGGYQVEKDGSIPKVLEIHDNTMRECVRVYGGK